MNFWCFCSFVRRFRRNSGRVDGFSHEWLLLFCLYNIGGIRLLNSVVFADFFFFGGHVRGRVGQLRRRGGWKPFTLLSILQTKKFSLRFLFLRNLSSQQLNWVIKTKLTTADGRRWSWRRRRGRFEKDMGVGKRERRWMVNFLNCAPTNCARLQ